MRTLFTCVTSLKVSLANLTLFFLVKWSGNWEAESGFLDVISPKVGREWQAGLKLLQKTLRLQSRAHSWNRGFLGWLQTRLWIEKDMENGTKLILESKGLIWLASRMKESACNGEDPGSIPGSGRSLGKGNGNALQYSCLDNSMGRGAWWATVHGVAKNWTLLSN